MKTQISHKFSSVVTMLFFVISTVMTQSVYAAGEFTDSPKQIQGIGADSLREPVLPSLELAQVNDGTKDHKAKIYEVKGIAKILKSDSEEWVVAQKDTIIEEGDQILTGEKSTVDIVYDANFLNVARIDEKTKAEFRSIEPTDLHLEDGAIYNALDGLNGSRYQISTPTAVAGVRGTTFSMTFDAETRQDTVFVFPDKSEHVGEVVVEGIGDSPIHVIEGQQLDPQGQIGDIPADKMEFAKELLEHIEENFGDFREKQLSENMPLNDFSEKDMDKNQNDTSTGSDKDFDSESNNGFEKNDDESRSSIGGPNDGGDSGGGPTDSLADSLLSGNDGFTFENFNATGDDSTVKPEVNAIEKFMETSGGDTEFKDQAFDDLGVEPPTTDPNFDTTQPPAGELFGDFSGTNFAGDGGSDKFNMPLPEFEFDPSEAINGPGGFDSATFGPGPANIVQDAIKEQTQFTGGSGSSVFHGSFGQTTCVPGTTCDPNK